MIRITTSQGEELFNAFSRIVVRDCHWFLLCWQLYIIKAERGQMVWKEKTRLPGGFEWG
jgi:hypothetical protein